MANLLQNMLTLQVEYRIPMRMDLSDAYKQQYYLGYKNTLESLEGERILSQVIQDLDEKERERLEKITK